MQQELWLQARTQVLFPLKLACAMRAAGAHPARSPEFGAANGPMASGGDPPASPRQPRPRSRTSSSTVNNSHTYSHLLRESPGRPEASSDGAAEGPRFSPAKASRSHQELHKELLLAHKKGLVPCSRPELQQVLERRRKERTQKEEGEQARSPLEQVLLQRQQRQEEKAREQEEKLRGEAQLLEFVRVRQNLRKIHSALHKPAASS
ncbi:actin-associated protein FAM107A [Denticeps clupeoides]|uniref:actin-associated protein FAM107A n=1 Tax=Denticeps clupeoides TaxID=299321 RepID=UPI0010A4E2EE|nr:actin-associated protein FAM107A-like [Denticeps clupeoides]XP_028850804.1 actin-associated protein FAM107A-like [Denticeps clupeoides]